MPNALYDPKTAETIALERARRILRDYAPRLCFICGYAGWCSHREPRAEMAILERLVEIDDRNLGQSAGRE